MKITRLVKFNLFFIIMFLILFSFASGILNNKMITNTYSSNQIYFTKLIVEDLSLPALKEDSIKEKSNSSKDNFIKILKKRKKG